MNRDIKDLEEMIQGDHDVESLTDEISGYIDVEREIAIDSAIDVLMNKYGLDIGIQTKAELVNSILDKIEPAEFL